MGRRIGPADPQRRQTVNLREGARHHDILACRDELDPRRVIVAADIFRIGGVEHEQHMRRQAGVQTLDLIERQIGAGRVVRIGEEDDLRLGRHRLQDRIDIRREVLLGRDDGPCPRRPDRDRIDDESVGRVDRLVSGFEIGVRDQRQQIIRSVAADDAAGVEPVLRRDRLAQPRRGAVGIKLEFLGDALERLDGARAGAERRFIGGQLVQRHASRRCRFTRLVGFDFHDAGARNGTCRRHRTKNSARTDEWAMVSRRR